MGLAHVTGGAARAFGPETLAKEERRDGLPFFIVLLAIAGAVVEWFFINDPVAQALDAWTFGGLFGRVAFALPVVMLLFAVWLFRHPSSRARQHAHRHRLRTAAPHRRRASATCSAASPSRARAWPRSPARAASSAGCSRSRSILLITEIGAAVVIIVLLLLALLIITKTPPNRIAARFRELYAWLFGAPSPRSATPPRSPRGARTARPRRPSSRASTRSATRPSAPA